MPKYLIDKLNENGIDYWVRYAEAEAASSFGVEVSAAKKRKPLLKFGRNTDLGTAGTRKTIWDVGANDETYATSNVINTISSSDAGDTQDVVVEYHTVDGSGNFTFGIQTVTLEGQSQVTLGTAAARVSRAYNNSGTVFAGDIYVYQSGQTVTDGVPQDATKTHLVIRGSEGFNQTSKCASTISNIDFYFITALEVGVLRNQDAVADFALEVRLKDKVFRERAIASSARSSGSVELLFRPFLIVPNNADFRVTAEASANNTQAIANVSGLLALDLNA